MGVCFRTLRTLARVADVPGSGLRLISQTRADYLPCRAASGQFAASGFPRLLHALGCGTPILPITFGPIVVNAEHLAVVGRASAALAPCCNVVSVHFVELINPALGRAVPNRAERTVGSALARGCLRLLARCKLV
jgi:hypothetical protein